MRTRYGPPENLKHHTERLVKKLEKKTLDLERKPAERRQAEEDLKKHRDHVEQMVEERTAELKKLVNAMSGREARMAELQEVIQKLRDRQKAADLEPVADDPLTEAEPDDSQAKI